MYSAASLFDFYVLSRKSFNIEEWFCGALQNSWCLTAVVQSSPLCPLSMESFLAMPGLVDIVQCFNRGVKHVVIQAFVSLPPSLCLGH